MKKSLQTSWNLGLLYKNDTDPQIEKDLLEVERACAEFEKKYKGNDFVSTPKKLADAFAESERLSEKTDAAKPWWYFHLRTSLNADDSRAGALATKNMQRLVAASNRIEFFSLEIAKIPKDKQKGFLNNPILAPYRYSLSRIFLHAVHNLSEGEEQLASLLHQPGSEMWESAGSRLVNMQTVLHKGEQIPLSKAVALIEHLSDKERQILHKKIVDTLKSVSYLAEAELNAIYNYKKVMDVRRGYAKPYSATILGYENDEKSIEALIALVTKRFDIAQRFYKLQAKILKKKKLNYADRAVKLGTVKKKFDFETSNQVLREMLAAVDPEYAGFLDTFLANGQIDAYPRKGKQGGAFCSGQGQLPTFVLLNHTDDVHSAETLAHEMGHAIHTELSKRQPPRYQHYTISVAEVASTFFEQMMSEEIEKHLSNKEKIIMLHGRIMGDISTIFRQIACFNFELELHNRIRSEGQVSAAEMAKLLAKHMQAYLGPAMDVTSDDGYAFVSWPHIRYFFYVYSYAYGQIVSRALFEKWKEDKSYAAKIKQFLSAGRSMSPEDIFKSIGIDTSKPEFFEAGLKSIEKDIARLEKLTDL